MNVRTCWKINLQKEFIKSKYAAKVYEKQKFFHSFFIIIYIISKNVEDFIKAEMKKAEIFHSMFILLDNM